eukprot:gb/GECG01005864.1/.p1 GENE.gb/GECG01005864.1/~~gb/GECG01005864.1/.p1  ORF type:complete len:145 (+),score=7.20 gb/GECG01005864.1/:1-435(+)
MPSTYLFVLPALGSELAEYALVWRPRGTSSLGSNAPMLAKFSHPVQTQLGKSLTNRNTFFASPFHRSRCLRGQQPSLVTIRYTSFSAGFTKLLSAFSFEGSAPKQLYNPVFDFFFGIEEQSGNVPNSTVMLTTWYNLRRLSSLS